MEWLHHETEVGQVECLAGEELAQAILDEVLERCVRNTAHQLVVQVCVHLGTQSRVEFDVQVSGWLDECSAAH